MSTSSHRNKHPRNSLAKQLATTFGRIDAPRVGRKSLLAVGLMTLLVTGAASADWYVKDRDAIKVLENIRDYIGEEPDTVNKNLDDLHEQQKIKGEKYNPDTDKSVRVEVKDDDLSAAATAKTARCGNKYIPAEQKPVCEAIVDLEQARYKYLKDMTELSKKREEALKKIYDERNSIAEFDQGALQSNTNRLLALLTHQRIDQVNLDMAMNIYDERIRDKREELTKQADNAMDPSRQGGSVLDTLLGGAAQAAVLAGALEVAKTRQR